MHLKSVTLKGFKSFPDRTRLEFDPGVSVVVGPNGSGKSNVTDAVLWALGEQSPVAVRGSSMQDVIFAGAPGRQAASSAEVELILDDSDGRLGLGVPEISIVRRLDRSGEGEYRLVGARCRLVDVIELLSDTGLGKEMHSVISQGRVESLVTSKPRDRRLLIEEAAGLGKHRKRRRRAQLKLERTQLNLGRALDVEREARSHLRPLKRQAEAAELHARLERQTLEARWQLVGDDVRACREQLRADQASVEQARARRAEVERELESVARRRELAEEALAARGARREELSRRCFVAQSAAERISYRAEAARTALSSIEARLVRERNELEALRSAARDDPGDQDVPSAITSAGRELDQREAELERALETRHEAEASLERARAELHEAERAVESARREAARIGGELASVNQFLRMSAGAPGGAAALADELQVEPGYELALAAALDGRLRAAVAPNLEQAARLLERAGAEGGRVLVADASGDPPTSGGDNGALAPLADHVRGDSDAADVARALLRDTWVVDSIEGLPASFGGTAVTRSGRVWSAANRELRQAPGEGDERVLAERNRREQLLHDTETAAQAEVTARTAHEQATDAVARGEAERDRAIGAHRTAIYRRDEAVDEQRTLQARVERAARQREQRERRISLFEAANSRDEVALPQIERLIEALTEAGGAILVQRERFEEELVADRAAGEQVAVELRACAQQEAELQTRLHAANELLTQLEVDAQRARDRVAELDSELRELAGRLELDPEPPTEPVGDEQRDALAQRIDRLARRREQLGPVNPLAREEYAQAVEHVEQLERQREDLETALRELEKLIRDTDREIRVCFEQTFAAAAANFEELATKLFPGGRGRLRLVSEREGPARVLGGDGEAAESEPETEEEDDVLGVEIEITPAGKSMKRLSLLSGGEKAMTALAFLFAVFLARPCPFYVLDEVEAALDDLNIDRFLELLRSYSDRAQFIVVTHQKRTMEAADALYGVSMGADGISKVISRRLPAQAAA